MEQQILQKLHTELLRLLPGQDLAPVFYQDGLLTQAEYDELQTKATSNDKNLHILACLGRRPSGMLSNLISCLEKQIFIPGVKEILQHLKETMKSSSISQADTKSADGAVGGAFSIGSAVDLSSSSEGETFSDPPADCSDFEDILDDAYDYTQCEQDRKAPEERIVLPDQGFPVKSQGIATKIVHGFQHMFDSDHGSCYFEFRKKKKPSTDHFSAFRVALGYLQVLWQNGKIQASVDFSKFSKSLEKRTVTIAFTGRNNAGKSTLLNAIIGCEMLPSHRQPETAVRVFLRHKDVCAMEGPELVQKCGKEQPDTKAHGREKILKYMKKRNEEVRNYQTKKDRKKQIMKDERLILHLDIPMLSSKSSRVFLVDTPGFAATNQAHLDDAAGRVLRASAAYVLLISYHQLDNAGDLSILDEVKSLDRAVSSDGRLIIAVTQHDVSYTQSGDGEMSPRQTIRFVSDNLKKLGHHINEDHIIPVSGKWALTARKLRKNPSDGTCMKEARRALTYYDEFQHEACGQDYLSTRPSDDHQTAAEALAKALENASNIGALESRIRGVIEQCDSVVCKNATSKIDYWLQEALRELSDDLVKKDAEFHRTRAQATHILGCISDIAKKEKELEDTITGKDNKVYQTLLQKYCHEAKKPCAKVEQLIPRHLTICKENCLAELQKATNQKKEPYSTSRLNDGIDKFVQDILSPAVQDVVKDGCIEQTRQVCKAYVSTYVPDQFRVMKDAACALPAPIKGGKTWKLPGATLDSVIGEIEESLILERFLEEHRLKAQDMIQWSWWDNIKAAVRVFLNRPEYGDPDTVKEALRCDGPDMDKIPVSEERINQLFGVLTDILLERTDQFFHGDDGIQKVVVEGFHAEYSRLVKEGLSDFKRVFGEAIDMEQKNLKKMDLQMKALGNEIDDLRYFSTELENLRRDWFLV